MPAPQMDLDPFKAEIQDRIAAGESPKDVRRWLAAQGVQIHRNTLYKRLQEWQGPSTQVPSLDATLVAEVDSAFHTTHHDDQTIAHNITASGIPTTHRQVKRIRLTQGWRRRGNTDDQLADSRAKTFAYNRCPSFFRSDRGKEVLLLADAHYSLYVLHKKATGTCPEDEDELKLRDCYMFGTSTANIKIESSWFRMIRSQTKPWLVCCI